MEHKGYLTDDGRVVFTVRPATDPGHARAGMLVAGDGAYIVGEVHHHVTRFNLRRVLVTRVWYVTRHPQGDDPRPIVERAIASSTTTREAALDAALAIIERGPDE